MSVRLKDKQTNAHDTKPKVVKGTSLSGTLPPLN